MSQLHNMAGKCGPRCYKTPALGLALIFGLTLATISIPSAEAANTGWLTFNGGYSANRYSPLKQITTRNVKSLKKVASYKLPETTSFQAGPVVVGSTMYFTTATSTYAINARTAKLLWSYKYTPKSMGLGTPVRGLAYANGRLYRGTPDARVMAMNAKTGEIIWNVEGGDLAKGEYFTVAPIEWKGLVYIGTSGSDIGTVGHMMAFRAKDGKKLWSFDIVPSAGPAAETWPSDPKIIKAGGGMYSSYALDTATGILYVPTGNPGPDFAGDYRPGDNLYTCSVVMLDAMTGKLEGYHQFVPHDVHDWDIAASPILYTSKSGRKMVAVGGKDGYLYGLDRKLKKVFFKVPVTRHINDDAPITPAGTRFAPGTQGGVNWNGPAYSPQYNALYVNSRDWATTVKLGGSETLENHAVGAPFIGSSNVFGDDDPQSERMGWLTSVNADTGRVIWKYRAPKPLVAGVTPTAGGLVFTGDLDGNLLAFNAANGKMLLERKTAGPIGGSVFTYAIDGKQYVAVAAGMKNGLMGVDSGPAALEIYAIPSHK